MTDTTPASFDDVIVDGDGLPNRTHPLWRTLARTVIARQILDDVTHTVLDVRDAVLLLDRDGDPVGAFDPARLDTWRGQGTGEGSTYAILSLTGYRIATAPTGGW